MKTKFDVGEEVFIRAEVKSIEIDEYGVSYKVEIRTDSINSMFLEEDQLERLVQQ